MHLKYTVQSTQTDRTPFLGLQLPGDHTQQQVENKDEAKQSYREEVYPDVGKAMDGLVLQRESTVTYTYIRTHEP